MTRDEEIAERVRRKFTGDDFLIGDVCYVKSEAAWVKITGFHMLSFGHIPYLIEVAFLDGHKQKRRQFLPEELVLEKPVITQPFK